MFTTLRVIRSQYIDPCDVKCNSIEEAEQYAKDKKVSKYELLTEDIDGNEQVFAYHTNTKKSKQKLYHHAEYVNLIKLITTTYPVEKDYFPGSGNLIFQFTSTQEASKFCEEIAKVKNFKIKLKIYNELKVWIQIVKPMTEEEILNCEFINLDF